MASVLTNVAQAAHSAAAAMLSAARIEASDSILQKTSQVPQYIADYNKFKAKDVKNICLRGLVAQDGTSTSSQWKSSLRISPPPLRTL
ncbi:hypothetical protein BDR05DRAFT_1002829 [Suillus weaverae]|nr:hypothetical protein BDR05DRAFT_1002829 [Suillus weaverae]